MRIPAGNNVVNYSHALNVCATTMLDLLMYPIKALFNTPSRKNTTKLHLHKSHLDLLPRSDSTAVDPAQRGEGFSVRCGVQLHHVDHERPEGVTFGHGHRDGRRLVAGVGPHDLNEPRKRWEKQFMSQKRKTAVDVIAVVVVVAVVIGGGGGGDGGGWCGRAFR